MISRCVVRHLLIGSEIERQLVERGDVATTIDVGKRGGLQDLEALSEEHPGTLQIVRDDLGAERRLLSGSLDALFNFATKVTRNN